MLIAVTVTTALYIFVILLSVSAYTEGCASWVDYITHLDRYKGIDRFPAFYAAHYYLAGVYILMASLLALVFSSGPPFFMALQPWRFTSWQRRREIKNTVSSEVS